MSLFAVDVRDRTAEFRSIEAKFAKPVESKSYNNNTNSAYSSSTHHSSSAAGIYNPNAINSSSNYHSSSSVQQIHSAHTSLQSSSYSSTSSSSSSSSITPLNSSLTSSTSYFTQQSSSISFSLISVTEKLERLSKLARGNSLFNDSSEEINQLTHIVKDELKDIDIQLNQLQSRLSHNNNQNNSNNSSNATGSVIHEQLVVKELKNSLAATTLTFQSALQKRTETLKDQNNRRKQFENHSSSASSAASSASAMNGPRRRNNYNNNNPMAELIEGNTNGHDLESADGEIDENQASLQRLLEPIQQSVVVDDYLNTRAAAVESIESTIVELGEMYQRLVTLVGMQEEVTLRIDANMDSTLENVTRGHQQLLNYFDSLSGNRSLIIKLFAILIVFIFFFMIFIA